MEDSSDKHDSKGKRKDREPPSEGEVPSSSDSEEERRVAPPKKRAKGKFRLNAAQLFCTWPKSDGLSKEEAIEQLDAKLEGNLKEYLIAEEEHEVKDPYPYPQSMSAADYIQYAETRCYLLRSAPFYNIYNK